MPTLDIFNNNAFSMASLTDAINKAPYKPARIAALGLFGEKGIPTTNVIVEERDGLLTLVPTSPRGGMPDSLGGNARRARSFIVPHLARRSRIMADAVQNVRAFGSETDLDVVQTVVNDRLATLRGMLEVTLEYHRIGAIRGVILDADGVTPIYDLFAEFGVAQQVHNFQFTSDTLDVRNRCVAGIRLIEDELGAAQYDRIRAFCSGGFFDALVGHAQVKETLKYQESVQTRADLRRGFEFGGILFEEYRGAVIGSDGLAKPFIPANEAVAFPEGVLTENGPLFTTYFAPADYMEAANTIGRPMYAKQALDAQFQKFVDLEGQSNPLAICLRPRACIRLTQN